jgi:iron complex outermembrane receptor protein
MRTFQPNLFRIIPILIILLTMFTVSNSVYAQTKGTITGRVTTGNNEPASHVSIGLMGTSFGAITNDKGEFSFKAPAGSYKIIISYVGVQTVEIPVSITSGQTTNVPTITVNASLSQLTEVNIIANRRNRFTRKASVDVAKIPLKNLENAQVYNTIPAELIQEQQIFTVDDAMRNAPGIQKMWEPTGRGGDGGSYYSLRGFTIQSALRNGIAGNVTSTIDAINLDKIEIIKGPSATLYGANLTSYGGLINRVTKKPYDTFGGEIGFGAGNYGFNRTSIDLNTPLNKEKNVLFRLNGAYNYEGSFQNNGFNRSFSVAPSLLYNVNDRLSISLDAELFYSKNIGKPIFFFPFGQTIAQLGYDSADKLPLDYRQSYYGSDLTQKSRSSNYFGQVKYKISDAITSSTNISSSNSYSDGFGPYYYLLPGDSISRNDQSTRDSKDHLFEIQQNFNADFKIGSVRNRAVFGLDYFRRNSNQFFFGSTLDAVPISSTYNYSGFNKNAMDALYADGKYDFTFPSIFKQNVYSAYFADVVNITDRLIASAGIRVDRFDNKGNFDPTTNTTSGAYKQTAWSPKFGLIYQPVKDMVSLFANYQNSFRNQSSVLEDNSIATPEHANQIEGGVKIDLLDGKLTSTISYYDIKVKDIVRPSATVPNRSIQDGTQLSRGIELEVVANPVVGLNVVAGFSYNDSKFDMTTNADVAGRRPGTASSPYLANLWLSYRIQQGIVKGLGFGFGGNYASNNKVINSRSQGVFTLPSYTILNASAFYDTRAYRLGFKMDNLTNEKYWIGYTTVNPQKLRSYAVTFAYKF